MQKAGKLKERKKENYRKDKTETREERNEVIIIVWNK